MSWAAILALAAGAYAFKAIGLLVLGPLASRSLEDTPTPAGDPERGDTEPGDTEPGAGTVGLDGGWPVQLGQLLPPALLAALIVNQTVTDGQSLVVDARLAGVVAGSLAVWRGAPFWLVITIAAAVTALLRLIAG